MLRALARWIRVERPEIGRLERGGCAQDALIDRHQRDAFEDGLSPHARPPARTIALVTSVTASALATTAGSARTAETRSSVSGSRATSFTMAEESR